MDSTTSYLAGYMESVVNLIKKKSICNKEHGGVPRVCQFLNRGKETKYLTVWDDGTSGREDLCNFTQSSKKYIAGLCQGLELWVNTLAPDEAKHQLYRQGKCKIQETGKGTKGRQRTAECLEGKSKSKWWDWTDIEDKEIRSAAEEGLQVCMDIITMIMRAFCMTSTDSKKYSARENPEKSCQDLFELMTRWSSEEIASTVMEGIFSGLRGTKSFLGGLQIQGTDLFNELQMLHLGEENSHRDYSCYLESLNGKDTRSSTRRYTWKQDPSPLATISESHLAPTTQGGLAQQERAGALGDSGSTERGRSQAAQFFGSTGEGDSPGGVQEDRVGSKNNEASLTIQSNPGNETSGKRGGIEGAIVGGIISIILALGGSYGIFRVFKGKGRKDFTGMDIGKRVEVGYRSSGG
ncbi:hypothetical protein C922_05188 [Plasmodium inui San Antonio 1]|uniref:Uncharacterized protein n=1 Tax=Plasmodium inui San Antonio 1 TaxID=1237626 RepID=W7A5S8_9APIC|nr:hypothetical protein C922_05188 [Plasmodium inui San Antonio 1]EUD64444.1 hypothetical protein C922_05188 [Plasmodium inui San Antonio 1]